MGRFILEVKMFYRFPAVGFLTVLIASVPAQAAAPDIHLKAKVFETDIRERFLLDGQIMCKMIRATKEDPVTRFNMPDNAYMTGIRLGTLALECAATGSEEAKAQAKKALDALHLLVTVSGKPGLLARAAVPADNKWKDDGGWLLSPDKKFRWRGDVSTDQMTGVFFGFCLYYDLAAGPAEKAVIRADAAALVDHLIDNDFRIIDANGKPTEWGNYTAQYVKGREPMNGLLLLQHLKVAYQVTGLKKYQELYEDRFTKHGYGAAAEVARAMNPRSRRGINHSDDVLIALAYYPLLHMEKDKAYRAVYLKSLKRSWEGANGVAGVGVEANPLHTFLFHAFAGDGSADKAAIHTLERFPLDMKWNQETIRKYEKRFGFSADDEPKSAKSKPGEVVPIDRRPKTWSAWVSSPYVDGSRKQETRMEYNGHDYLLGYWLGRYHGFIKR